MMVAVAIVVEILALVSCCCCCCNDNFGDGNVSFLFDVERGKK